MTTNTAAVTRRSLCQALLLYPQVQMLKLSVFFFIRNQITWEVV